MIVHMHRGGADKRINRVQQNVNMAWQTVTTCEKAKYCHVELQFDQLDQFENLSFSARGFDNEVGFKDIKYSHPERWDSFKLILSPTEEANICNRCIALSGDKYDYMAPFRRFARHNGRWYCFEAINHVLGFEPCNVYGNETIKRIKANYTNCLVEEK